MGMLDLLWGKKADTRAKSRDANLKRQARGGGHFAPIRPSTL